MATIKLSKAQWEFIGQKTGWTKAAGMEALNVLERKGWVKKLPNGSFIRTFWPQDVFEKEVVTNQELKRLLEKGKIQQQPNGGYELVEDPDMPTVLDNKKPMPIVS